ncbi:hypothetical protein N9T65_00290 [Candidatus Pelagibacter sp.]|nr:hypothetical protein [Candidatus Pelagibacter sp.]MDA9663299.1 hypothetical protein [Candidatus Pelagibacter sp.]
MDIKAKIPSISKQIYKEDIEQILLTNFSLIGGDWISNQLAWAHEAFKVFKDHEKYLMIIYLVKKTLDWYSKNFTKISYDTFFSKKELEIGKFNIVEISNFLKIPKETVRRKIIELEKVGVIKRIRKKIILDKTLFLFMKPINSTKRIASFLSKVSRLLKKQNILLDAYSSNNLHKYICEDFSYSWKLFYQLQLPLVVNWKSFFKDLETWHIWATCIYNKSLSQEVKSSNLEYKDFVKKMIHEFNGLGLSAMSISDITGIPRPTVVRKLRLLMKKKHLVIDKKKLYHPHGGDYKEMIEVHQGNIKLLSIFVADMFNQYSYFTDKKID